MKGEDLLVPNDQVRVSELVPQVSLTLGRVVGAIKVRGRMIAAGSSDDLFDHREMRRVRLVKADYQGSWELPAVGAVAAPAMVLIRPDGYVAWVGDQTQQGLADALTTWFGPPAAA